MREESMNKPKTIVSIFHAFYMASALVLGGGTALGADLPKMPPTVGVMGHTLQLNGAGLRTATVLRVKVYEAGLYLSHRSSNAQQILNSKEPKVVRLTFLRDVSSDQVRDAWKDDFKKNCAPNCAALQPVFDQLVSKIPEAKKGDVFVYVFTPKGINIIRNGNEVDGANNPELAKAILSFWLGKEPPSTELKQAMLGITPNEDIS
jgi:hypothetical protein